MKKIDKKKHEKKWNLWPKSSDSNSAVTAEFKNGVFFRVGHFDQKLSKKKRKNVPKDCPPNHLVAHSQNRNKEPTAKTTRRNPQPKPQGETHSQNRKKKTTAKTARRTPQPKTARRNPQPKPQVQTHSQNRKKKPHSQSRKKKPHSQNRKTKPTAKTARAQEETHIQNRKKKPIAKTARRNP